MRRCQVTVAKVTTQTCGRIDSEEVRHKAQGTHHQPPAQEIVADKARLVARHKEVDGEQAKGEELIEPQIMARTDLGGVVNTGVLNRCEEVTQSARVIVNQRAAEAGNRPRKGEGIKIGIQVGDDARSWLRK